jgi:predicted NBD/HSP70 family sugar kinase
MDARRKPVTPQGQTATTTGWVAARPRLIRAMNEQLLLEHIRQRGPCSRAELARVSGLSKPTVSLALGYAEQAGLVRPAGQRTGQPGRTAQLYELQPDTGFALALGVSHDYLRGALADLSGEVRTRISRRARTHGAKSQVEELVQLADALCAETRVCRTAITQTVIGSPRVCGPRQDAAMLTSQVRPFALAGLREAFGSSLVLQNDVHAAALAEYALGHGQDTEHFAFAHFGTAVGVGLVIGGQLVRGAHGVAGDIAFLPLTDGIGIDGPVDRTEGMLEAASEASLVRAARRVGMGGEITAPRVLEAAAAEDQRAVRVVTEEARLAARVIRAVIAVVDPELIVLGGSVGQAPSFARLVCSELDRLAPPRPHVRVSALGAEAVVDGCLAVGIELAWAQVMAAVGANCAD